VLKDLGSKWDPSDRSGKWLKLKPDYIRAGSDLDVLIIGLYFNFFSSFHICLLQSNM
jgi:DNA ligase-4